MKRIIAQPIFKNEYLEARRGVTMETLQLNPAQKDEQPCPTMIPILA